MIREIIVNGRKYFDITAAPKQVTIPSGVPITGPFEEQGHIFDNVTLSDDVGTTFTMHVTSADENYYSGTLTVQNDPSASLYPGCVWVKGDHYFVRNRNTGEPRTFKVPKSLVTNVIWGGKAPLLSHFLHFLRHTFTLGNEVEVCL